MSEAFIGHELDEEHAARQTSVTAGKFPDEQTDRMSNGYQEQTEGRVGGTSYLGDILDAQQRLISSQHQYLHDNDPAKLLRAQLHVINVYNGVLDSLGVYG